MFYIDEEIEKTYDELIDDLNHITEADRIIDYKDDYSVYLFIIISLINNESTFLIDNDLLLSEKEEIVSNVKTRFLTNKKIVKDKSHLIELVNDTNLQFELNLLTSGTTGKPKRITHNRNSLIRTTKVSKRYHSSKWGQCYNPTHFAGLQVFFQVLLNGATLINLFKLKNTNHIDLINKLNVTNISMTPTFFRHYFQNSKVKNLSVRTVSFGGEKSNIHMIEEAKEIFPVAKVNNIYASTEFGVLFSSNDEVFTVPKDIKSKVLIKNGILHIHSTLMPSNNSGEEWVNTGDFVEILSDSSFKFIARNSEFINIGGYNVDPNEIEELLCSLEYIKDCKVTPRNNSVMGKVLIAELLMSEDLTLKKKEIKKLLRNSLQEWKIPSLLKQVDQIKYSRTGKKSRG
tara:strand:+ start:9308 stop:10510 length:1203 start_codon:yes stop_codon:yes gene_type:complete